MRRGLIFIVLSAFILAACGGGDATETLPTLAVAPDGSTPQATFDNSRPETWTPEAAQQFERTVIAPEGEVVPVAGTLMAPATEDPDAGLVFDWVVFEQSGGGQDAVIIRINQDGTGTRNETPISVPQDQVIAIDNMLDQIGFFGLEGSFTAPGTSAEAYRYRLNVMRAGANRIIDAHEGFIPLQLQQIFDAIAAAGAV